MADYCSTLECAEDVVTGGDTCLMHSLKDCLVPDCSAAPTVVLRPKTGIVVERVCVCVCFVFHGANVTFVFRTNEHGKRGKTTTCGY